MSIVKSKQMLINWADIPKFCASGDLWVAAWPQILSANAHGYGLQYSYSTDKGKTWSAPAWLHSSRKGPEYGFISMTPTKDGEIAAIWLDSNEMETSEDGNMNLFYRTITASGLGPEITIDDMVCDCCATSLVNIDGKLLAAYRNKDTKQIRDIETRKFVNGKWEKANLVHPDGWEIHGCPVNGPVMDHRKKLTAIAWHTGAKGAMRTQLGISQDGGKTFTKKVVISEKSLGRVDCKFVSDDRVAVSWLGTDDKEESKVMVAVYQIGKELTPVIPKFELETTSEGRSSGFPRIISFKGKFYAAYQDEHEVKIKMKQIEL